MSSAVVEEVEEDLLVVGVEAEEAFHLWQGSEQGQSSLLLDLAFAVLVVAGVEEEPSSYLCQFCLSLLMERDRVLAEVVVEEEDFLLLPQFTKVLGSEEGEKDDAHSNLFSCLHLLCLSHWTF